jgi:molybdate transport system substrate-binding protein
MRMLGVLALALLGSSAAEAGQTHVAVAANFADAAREIAAAYKAKSGHDVVLSFGATGQLYTQITQGAPFDILLAADDERPKKAVADGIGMPGSRFTYAVGKLVLWSRTVDVTGGEDTLKAGGFNKLALANPAAAPYGVAAIETLKALKLHDALLPKIVQGNSIAQTYQFIDTGNAEVGFVALSQLSGATAGTRWVVPQALYTPIRQDAVLLKSAAANEAAAGFITFLKGPAARAIIATYGYDLSVD